MTTGYAQKVFGLIPTQNGHEVRSLTGDVYSRITGLPASHSDVDQVVKVINEAPSVVPPGAELVPASVHESMVELGDVVSVTTLLRNGQRVNPMDSTKMIGASELIRDMAFSDSPFEVTSSFQHERGLLRGKKGYEISNQSGNTTLQVNAINGTEPSVEAVESLVSSMNFASSPVSPSRRAPKTQSPSRGPKI